MRTNKAQKKLAHKVKKQNSDLIYYLATNCFVILTVFFFFPIEVFLSNLSDFDFPIGSLWWLLLCIALFGALLVSFFEYLISRKYKKNAEIINTLLFIFGICYYIQGLFLNNQVPSFTGELSWFEPSVKIKNLLIWLFISLAVFLFCRKKKESQKYLSIVSCMFVFIELVGLSTLLINTLPGAKSFPRQSFSAEGQFELSARNNVVVFILDTCDNRIVDMALEKYPDLFDGFHDFVYYPNTVSTYSRTYPSIIYLLTGVRCYFDLPFTEYIQKAWESGSFLPRIKKAGTDIRVFIDNNYAVAETEKCVDNTIVFGKGSLRNLSLRNIIIQSVKISGYKGLPYWLKMHCYYTVGEVNNSMIGKDITPGFFYEHDDLFFHALKEKGLSVNENFHSAFRFYHLFGVHSGFCLNENGEFSDASSVEDALKGCMKIIASYLEELQRLNLYEKTTVIITTDHGDSYASKDLLIHDPVTALFMIKSAEKGTEHPLIIDNSPISHENWFATVLQAFECDTSDYEVPVSAVQKNDNTDRYYYHSALVSDLDGEVALREYRIHGDARFFENWELTGKKWDICFSQNNVSKTRLNTENR